MAPGSRGWCVSVMVRYCCAALLAFTAVAVFPEGAWAQACCAGAGAVTPGRLAIHEDALVGLQFKVAHGFGSFSSTGTYLASPPRTTEWELEQDLVAALRVLPRGQLALLVPVIQTYRRTPSQSEFGGGFGDVNFSARYDFTWAGEARYIPGIALLAGVTFPTGESIEQAENRLGTDATGVGAYQGNLGLALEHIEGPWLFGVTGLVARRASRTVGSVTTLLAPQWTLLAATAYTFPNDAALAALVSYAVEGDPEVNGRKIESTRRVPLFGVAGVYPFTDQWRLQGGLYFNPPLAQLGRNTPALVEFVLSVLRTWS
jgi:hypothetical protein